MVDCYSFHDGINVNAFFKHCFMSDSGWYEKTSQLYFL